MSHRSEFEELAMVHLDPVYRAAVALCGRADLAEDLAQTTFMKAFQNFAAFERGTNCKAWLMRILRNTWIDKLRRRRFTAGQVTLDENLVVQEEPPAATVWSDAEDLLENFGDEQVIEALRELPEEQRLTLYLMDVEQMTQEEVAEITGVATGTVKSRTSRARAALKQSLCSYSREMRLTGNGS